MPDSLAEFDTNGETIHPKFLGKQAVVVYELRT